MNNYMQTSVRLLTLFFALTVFSGCSKQEQTAGNNATAANVLEQVKATAAQEVEKQRMEAEQAKRAAQISALPKADPGTPLSQYKEWRSNRDVMFSYLGLSGLPVNYEVAMQEYSKDYRQSSDEFRKNDILSALKPKLDQEIAAAKTQLYVKMVFDNFRVDKFDFQAKGFPQSQLTSDTNFGWSSEGGRTYRAVFTNADQYKLMRVADEAKARSIEERRSKYQNMNLVIYGFTQDVDTNNQYVKVQILKISLQDGKGAELLSL